MESDNIKNTSKTGLTEGQYELKYTRLAGWWSYTAELLGITDPDRQTQKNVEDAIRALPEKAFQAGAEWADQVLKNWVPVETRLPGDGKEGLFPVLVCLQNDGIFRAEYSGFTNRWLISGLGTVEDTNPAVAWQPLPEPYRAENN